MKTNCATIAILVSAILVCPRLPLAAAQAETASTECIQLNIDVNSDHALHTATHPSAGACKVVAKSGGFQVPDPHCTPGAINSTVTIAVLKSPEYKTECVRDKATTEEKKEVTYQWYGIPKPSDNQGANEMCELDHLVPLYLGGADTLDNIWPQCGPNGVSLDDRYFKQKDRVEYYLGQQVRMGKMKMSDAQQGIAKDWTVYISATEEFCKSATCKSAN